MKTKNIVPLLVSIALAQLAGVIGSIFTAPSIATWYAALAKPSFTPPNWLFGPAWLTLYTLMGIAAYIIWLKRRQEINRFSLRLYGMHLGVNAIWSIIFFGLHDITMALLVSIALWLMILVMILLFYRTSKLASYLLIPYLVWVSYATALNAALWMLN